VGRAGAKQDKLADLQANFNKVPAKFMEAVKSVDMKQRRKHLPNNEWNTRFVRNSVEAPPGESAAASKLARKRDAQASRSIPSDR
jgi:hypothetical protein